MRGFFVPMDRYEPQKIEEKVAARLGGRARVPHARPAARRGAARPLVPARDAAVPLGDAAHGARPELHDGRRPHALPAPARVDRAAADGLGLVRPARGERRDPRGRPPARDRRAEHRRDPRPDEADRLGDRLGPRDRGTPPRLLPAGRSGCSCGSSSAGSPTARRRRSTGARTTRPSSRTST